MCFAILKENIFSFKYIIIWFVLFDSDSIRILVDRATTV